MSDAAVREHVLYVLTGGGAHLSFEDAIAGWPESKRGLTVQGCPHTAWRLLEHMRICQWDIVEFSRDAAHISPAFPDGLWPSVDAPPSNAAWDESIQRFRDDLQIMIDMVRNPDTNLYTPLPHGDGQTILREALLVADHNAYHLGQLAFLRHCLQG